MKGGRGGGRKVISDQDARRWGTQVALLAHRPKGYRSKCNDRLTGGSSSSEFSCFVLCEIYDIYR